MENKTTFNLAFIVRCAVLLALTLAFQMLRLVLPPAFSPYIIGTLVNVALIVSAGVVGLPGGIVIAVIAPVVAMLQGHAALPMVAPIALGNAVIVVAGYFALRRRMIWVLAPGAVLKYVIIALGMAWFMLGGKNPTPYVAAFTQQIVQLVTAVIGSFIAIPTYVAVRKALKD